MNRNLTAGVNNLSKANGQLNAAQQAAVSGQPGNASKLVNAAANNAAKANVQLNNAANTAQGLGLNKVAANLKNAAKKIKQAKLVDALNHTANAVKAMNSNRT